ncbi:MAG: AraC family transcriptional regulator [Treponema sp.]|jgi:AraC-like DNA-binding protein|nr:AraC family transcriptional regulator [Treponema sp.]
MNNRDKNWLFLSVLEFPLLDCGVTIAKMKECGPKRFDIDHITNLKLESYEFVLAFAAILDNGPGSFLQQHPFYEIHYALDEPFQIMVKDKIITCAKNKPLILAKNVKHQLFFQPNRSFNYFVCMWDILPIAAQSCRGPEGEKEYTDLRNSLEQLDKSSFILSKIPFDGSNILSDVGNEWINRQLAWNSTVCFKLHEFIIKSLRHTTKPRVTDKALAGIPNYVLRANKFLHSHFAESITLEDVAGHANISPRHLNHVYMQIFNTSVMHNLSEIRIEYAKKYLCSTDFSIEKIAEIVGFTSARTLYKLFRKYAGITISQYRENKQRKDIC